MKLNLIYYKNILDIAVRDFFSIYGSQFTKSDGKYVLSAYFSKSSLEKTLEKLVASTIREIASSISNAYDYLIVIGSCYPKDNLLLQFKDNAYFPQKLQKLISEKPDLKWILAENDIDIGMPLFNEAFMHIFNKMLDSKKAAKILGDGCYNVLAVSHSKLDCYAMFKTIKWAFGSSNCVNVWKEKLSCGKSCLVAVNDLVARYISNKTKMNKSHIFRMCANEVKDYLSMKLGLADI